MIHSKSTAAASVSMVTYRVVHGNDDNTDDTRPAFVTDVVILVNVRTPLMVAERTDNLLI